MGTNRHKGGHFEIIYMQILYMIMMGKIYNDIKIVFLDNKNIGKEPNI